MIILQMTWKGVEEREIRCAVHLQLIFQILFQLFITHEWYNWYALLFCINKIINIINCSNYVRYTTVSQNTYINTR